MSIYADGGEIRFSGLQEQRYKNNDFVNILIHEAQKLLDARCHES